MTLADAGYFACQSTWRRATGEASRWRWQRHGSGSYSEPYHKDRFAYDEQSDRFTCPQGRRLQVPSHPTDEWRSAASVPSLWHRLPGVTSLRRLHESPRDWPQFWLIGPHDAVLRRHRAWTST